MRSCNVPWKCGTDLALLLNLMDLHRLYRPLRQMPHVPHGMPTSRATRSPMLKPVTWGPMATTVPEDSWPSESGMQAQRSPLANFL
jgi:hypothetical protein